jgi:hypothetical protein
MEEEEEQGSERIEKVWGKVRVVLFLPTTDAVIALLYSEGGKYAMTHRAIA